MKHTSEFYNEMWASIGESSITPDGLLETHVGGLTPGRALEIGCGTGSNAVWLAEQGWDVTAIDFSDVAIEMARKLAKAQGVSVDFIVADATTYQPDGKFDLVISFYIQLQAEQRAKMLEMASEAVTPGGTLLFVSHDRTSSLPSEWDADDLLTLTTPDEIVSEIHGLKVEDAAVLKGYKGAHARDKGHEGAHPHGSEDTHCSTVVLATKPAQ